MNIRKISIVLLSLLFLIVASAAISRRLFKFPIVNQTHNGDVSTSEVLGKP